MSNVTLDGIVKRYGALEVVHGVSLDVAHREFIVLVGPSGCGKSTILRMIAGLEEISGGTIEIGGKTVNKVAPKDRDVAMVFQNYALYPHLNVAENIAFGLRVRGEKRAVVERAVREAANMLGLTEYLARKPADLSGGQRQRVAMGRAIVRQPKVFLFDEPLSNLDAKLRTYMRAEIKRLHQRMDVTSIYVTHDQIEAMTLADRIVIMNGGRIEQVGTPTDVFLRPANTFVAEFIGSPPMNLLDAEIAPGPDGPVAVLRDGQSLAISAHTANGAEGRPVRLGIRPESFSIAGPGESLACTIELVEPLGSEALLHARAGEDSFIARIDTVAPPADLAAIRGLHVDPTHVHIFDPVSGRACGGIGA